MSFKKNTIQWIILLLSLPIVFLCVKQSPAQKNNFKHEIGFKSDNDFYLFTTQDRYYTNGLYISFKTVLTPSKMSEHRHFSKRIINFEIGQAIFNPQTAFVSDSSEYSKEIDRPFAGWLYTGSSLSLFNGKGQMFQFGFQFGTIGQNSLAEKVQTTYHKNFDFDPPEGWETQVKNEMGINILFGYTRSIHVSKKNGRLDIHWIQNTSLGNIFTNTSTAFLFRFGKFEKLSQSLSFQSRISNEGDKEVDSEFFFFLKPTLSLIIYDATIQGGMFNTTSPFTFSPTLFVAGSEAGVAFAKSHWTISLNYIFKSPENHYVFGTSYGNLNFFYQF